MERRHIFIGRLSDQLVSIRNISFDLKSYWNIYCSDPSRIFENTVFSITGQFFSWKVK